MLPSFFYNCESFAPNLPWSESDLYLYTRWLKMCYSRSVLMFFLALKTFCLMLRLEHSMRTCRDFLVAAWPTLCDTAISCGWSGGSTFMAAQRVSTAASVSSFSSSQECLISPGYHAAHAVLTGLAFCSMIVIFKAQISLFLVSSSSCKGFNCFCISLEIRSANSCRLGWIICFSWPLISGDLRAAPRHKMKWSGSILS